MKRQGQLQVKFNSQTGPPAASNGLLPNPGAGFFLGAGNMPFKPKGSQPIPSGFGLPGLASLNVHPGGNLQESYAIPHQTGRDLLRQSVDSGEDLSNSGSDDVQYASKDMVEIMLHQMDIPVTQFTKAINFEALSHGADPTILNGYSQSGDNREEAENISIEEEEEDDVVQYTLDTSADLMEQQQAVQQSALMKQFKQLREWQQQQQEMLMIQQQQQLEKLREDQERVQRMIAKQREMQWGATGSGKDGFTSMPSQMATARMMVSPKKSVMQCGARLSKSSVPGSLELMQHSPGAHPPQSTSQVGHPYASFAKQRMMTPVEVGSDQLQYVEDGVYPLPDSESELEDPPSQHYPREAQYTKGQPHGEQHELVVSPGGGQNNYHQSASIHCGSGDTGRGQLIDDRDFSDDDYDDVSERMSDDDYSYGTEGEDDDFCENSHHAQRPGEESLQRGNLILNGPESRTVNQRNMLEFRDQISGSRHQESHAMESLRDNYQGDMLMDRGDSQTEMIHREEECLKSQPEGTTCFDDMPVLGLAARKKTFEELLEEELRKEEQKTRLGSSGSGDGKRRFLRKGEGVARFSGRPIQRRPRTTSVTVKTTSSSTGREKKPTLGGNSSRATVSSQRLPPGGVVGNSRNATSCVTLRRDSKQSETPVTRGLPPKAGGVKRKVLTGPQQQQQQGVQEKSQPQGNRPQSNQRSASQLQCKNNTAVKAKKSIPEEAQGSGCQVPCKVSDNDSLGETSFHRCLKVRAEIENQEEEQLEEFEILEQYADDNASFMSNMSAVDRVVQQTRGQQRPPPSMQPITNIVKPLPTVCTNPCNVAKEITEDKALCSESESDDETSVTTDFDDEHEDSDDDEGDVRDNGNVQDDTLVESPSKDCPQGNVDSTESQHTMFVSCKQKSPVDNMGTDTASGHLLMSVQQFSDSESECGGNLQQPPAQRHPEITAHCHGDHTESDEEKVKVDSTDALIKDSSDQGKNESGKGAHRYIETTDDDQSVSDVLDTHPKVNGSDPIAHRIDFDDDEAWDEESRCEDSTPTVTTSSNHVTTSSQPIIRKTIMTRKTSKVFPDQTEEIMTKEEIAPVPTPPPTSTLVAKLFPQLKKEVVKPKPVPQVEQQVEVTRQVQPADGAQSKILRDRLLELEREIEKFRTENAALTRLRKEREDGITQLKKEMEEFDKQKNEELTRLQAFKTEETKKLKREKKQFEQYQKAMKAMPDKKEREEIETLKTQVSELQEELKRKESRWTSSMTRLRERCEQLSTENTELTEEIRLLEKQRLLAWQQKESAPKKKEEPPRSVPKKAALTEQKSPKPESQPTKFIPRDSALRLSTNLELDRSDPQDDLDISNPLSGAMMLPTQLEPEPVRPVPLERNRQSSPRVEKEGGQEIPRQISRKRSVPLNISHSVDKGNEEYEEIQHTDGKVEKIYTNGAREILFANGTRTQVSADGQAMIVSFFNGDMKQIMPDQRVVYYFADAQTTQTTYPDGLEILQFPNQQTEKHYPDGTKEITFPDQTIRYLFPNGTEESIYSNGTVVRIEKNGDKTVEFPNGQREIHTQQYKRREYPDGTVKTVFPDRRQETRYSSGRVRVKDQHGNIIVDKRM